MLTQAYIEALLIDENLADQVWEALDNGEIDDMRAYRAWLIIADFDRALTEQALGVLGSLF